MEPAAEARGEWIGRMHTGDRETSQETKAIVQVRHGEALTKAVDGEKETNLQDVVTNWA